MKTERITILVTPEQKRAITTQAKKLKLSAGEVIRRAVEGYRPNKEEMVLNALADELDREVKEARKVIKEAITETRRTLDQTELRCLRQFLRRQKETLPLVGEMRRRARY